MKRFLIMALMTMTMISTFAEPKDTVEVHYIHKLTPDDERIFESNLQKTTLYVNDQVTTHIIMPENIKMVDISTDKLVGNQCADNIVRLKPKSAMMDNELAGTVTVIGERHIAQFTIYFTKGPRRLTLSIRCSKQTCVTIPIQR